MSPTDHYFSDTPDAPSDPFEITVRIGERTLQLTSDTGVFSKTHADPGSVLLWRNATLPEDGDILDLGCGYGLVGVLAAMDHPRATVVMVDVNSRATALARLNADRYQLANIEVLTGDAREVLGDRTFDSILCNPPYRAGKSVTMPLLADAAGRLRPGGTLWVVGRTKQGIRTLARDIEPLFGSVETVDITGGYRVMACRARGS